MTVSLYLYFEKIGVDLYTMEAETIEIYNLEIYDTSIASGILCNSIGSKHMVQSWTQFS